MGITDFQLVSKLGLGAYGSVYKVIRKVDGQTYAIKRVNLERLDQKDLAMALNEIRLLASFHHPRIVRFYETFLEHNHLCVVMEYCGFQDLERKIKRYKKRKEYVDERVIWVYVVQTLEALQALHSLKILHRDIKPANILLDEEGSAKLGDLNVSKIMMDENEVSQTVIGTLCYMAPEIWAGKPYAYPADIYSLGCTLFELAALAPPFDGASPLHIRKAVLKRQFKATIPEHVYSQDLRDVISTLLHPEPEERLTAERLLALPQVSSRLYLVRHKLPPDLAPPTPIHPSSLIDEAAITLQDLPALLPTILPGPSYPTPPPTIVSPSMLSGEERGEDGEEGDHDDADDDGAAADPSSPSSGGGMMTRKRGMAPRISIVPITVDPSKLIYRKIDEPLVEGAHRDDDDDHSTLKDLLRSPFAEGASASKRRLQQQQQQQQHEEDDHQQQQQSEEEGSASSIVEEDDEAAIIHQLHHHHLEPRTPPLRRLPSPHSPPSSPPASSSSSSSSSTARLGIERKDTREGEEEEDDGAGAGGGRKRPPGIDMTMTTLDPLPADINIEGSQSKISTGSWEQLPLPPTPSGVIAALPSPCPASPYIEGEDDGEWKPPSSSSQQSSR